MSKRHEEMIEKVRELMGDEILESYEPVRFDDFSFEKLYQGTPVDSDQSLVAHYIKDFTEYPDHWELFIVEENGYIHDGNHRHEAMKLAGKTWDVPVIILKERKS